ncbi:MAG: low molecular weight phosphotyrosine protein phosphatase, partial [Butyricicoccus sp.]|nr:low molecular weight phosphotyrosine protein phosphatase [Butyricicoccus sp.]
MIRILFICHGNICRSPMAEFVMKDMVKKAGLASEFQIDSAATSTEELGNPVYPPARRKLAEHGIGCAGKTARQLTRIDYDA